MLKLSIFGGLLINNSAIGIYLVKSVFEDVGKNLWSFEVGCGFKILEY